MPLLYLCPIQPQRIGNYRHRAETHRRRRNDGREQQAEKRVQHPRRNWDAKHVIDEGEK